MHFRPFGRPLVLALLILSTGLSTAYAAPLLKQIAVVRDGVGGFTGLAGVYDLVFSADGKHAYSAAYGSSAVSVFSVDTTTGALTQQQVLQDLVGGVTGIGATRALRLSPDDKFLYAAGETSNAIAIFSRDAASGQLAFNSAFTDGGPLFGLWRANAMNLSPDGNFVYASSEFNSSLSSFARDAVSGALTHVQTLKDNDGTTSTLASIRSFTISADGRYLYAPSRDDDAITQFDRDASSGEVTQNSVLSGAPNFEGPTHVTFSPDGLHAYVTSQLSDSLSVFDVDAATGHLQYKTTYFDNTPGFSYLNHAEDMAISADGSLLMVTGTLDGALSIYLRNPVTGELTFHQAFQNGQNGIDSLFRPRELILSPNGRYLYVMAPEGNAITIFQVPEPGTLTLTSLALVGLLATVCRKRRRREN